MVTTAPLPVFPLTTSDPARELAMELMVITEAVRMAGLDAEPQVVAALIQASAMADLTEAVRGAAAALITGLDEVAAAIN